MLPYQELQEKVGVFQDNKGVHPISAKTLNMILEAVGKV